MLVFFLLERDNFFIFFYQLGSQQVELIDLHAVLLVDGGFLPSREHDDVPKLVEHCFVDRLGGHLSHALVQALVLVLPSLDEQLETLDLFAHDVVHVLVAQHFALGLPELGLEAIILLLDSLRLLLAD